MEIRTQYDAKDASGEYTHPPSRDAHVSILVENPFNQPRYPCVSCCEIGAYIAEILGVKDNRVIPFDKLKKELADGKRLQSTEWPYSYSGRLTSFPTSGGEVINQLESALERISSSLITRRAVATTRLPEIDSRLDDDLPCLGEVHLRTTEEDNNIYLHMSTFWRSRDLFKAWHDNVIGLTFMQQVLAKKLGEKLNRGVKVGSYYDVSNSLHIYGQDIVGGASVGRSARQYVESGEEEAIGRAMSSEDAKENLVVPQLESLLSPQNVSQWGFGDAEKSRIRGLIFQLNQDLLIA
jgi:hypothetical protein